MTRTVAAQPTTASRMRRLTAVALPAAVAGWIVLGGTPLSAVAGSLAHTRPPVRTATPSALPAHPAVAVAPSRTFTVTSTADAHDPTPGDGVCDTASNGCTLRAAIEDANGDSGLTAITAGAGTYTLSLGELQITASSGMDITGARSGGVTTIDGGHATRVLQVSVTSGSLVTVSGLSIENGLGPVDGSGNPLDGGGVLVDPNVSLELSSVEVHDNSTAIDAGKPSGNGGGIADEGQIWLIGSLVHDNTANEVGGGVYNDGAARIESDNIVHNTAHAAASLFAGGGGIDNNGTVDMSGTNVGQNSAPYGGGISNYGDANISDSSVTYNTADSGWGGGVDNESSLSMVASQVTGNHAVTDGGGVAHDGSSLSVTRSTIFLNSASADGGGVASEVPGVVLTNDTIARNNAGRGGGLILHHPTTLQNVTVAGNGGGGIGDRNSGGENPELDVEDSIVAANGGGNCTAALQVRSLGHNLDSDGTCTLSAAGDISNRDARLGPLQGNGGPNPTMALLMNSPAIDAGDSRCPAVDQRGVPRPQGAACDMGAFELAPYYWTVASDGGVFSFGGAPFLGSEGGTRLNAPVVGMASTPDGLGYWLVASDGGVFAFGDAGYFGSRGGQHLNQPVVGMAPTPDGGGYWLVARDGGVFSFGDATFFGSEGDKHLNAPIVGMAADPNGRGYWLVGSDGGIFTLGTQGFFGSEGNTHLNAPVVGMAAAPDGNGYWMVASDGGVFAHGSAGFFGSMGATRLNKPVVGMAAAPDGQGYWLVASDGGIFNFAHALFFGSTGNIRLNAPMVGMAGV